MTKEEFIIVLDQGSSSSRALAFDLEGNIRFKAQRKIALSYPQAGYAEYDGMELLRSQTESLKKCWQSFRKRRGALLGLAAQRSTVVLWDKETGVPLCPALSWQDGGALGELAKVPLSTRPSTS